MRGRFCLEVREACAVSAGWSRAPMVPGGRRRALGGPGWLAVPGVRLISATSLCRCGMGRLTYSEASSTWDGQV